MKKNYLIALMALATCPGVLQAKVIDPNEARTIATQYINIGTQPQMKAFKVQGNNKNVQAPDFYVFNDKSGQGFVLVAGDDCVSPVLGYSRTGKADANNMPPALKAWLESISQYISTQRQQNGGVAKTRTARVADNPGTPIVEPIVKTHWSQDEPYFNQTPTIQDEHAVTCCVATAMAQIFNHYKYPAHGTGAVDYETPQYDQKRISIDFSKSTYDWDNMLDDYTTGDDGTKNWNDAQAAAVSTLMRDIGAALHVSYNLEGNGGSGAYSEDERTAAAHHFGYMATTYDKNEYSMKQWIDLLQKCFDEGNPVVICGFSKKGFGNSGHSFVGDGYDSNDNIHINWGWAGEYDGYYNFYKFGPKNYNFNVGMNFTEFSKDESGQAANKIKQPVLTIDRQNLIDSEGQTIDKSAIRMEADKLKAGISMIASYTSWDKYEGRLKLGLYDKDGKTMLGTIGKECKLDNDLRQLTNKDILNFIFTSDDFASLKDGNYQIVPLSNNTDDDNNWVKASNNHIFGIEKGDGNIMLTLSLRDTGMLTQIGDIMFDKDSYDLSDIANFSVGIANNSDKDFGGEIYANLKNTETGEELNIKTGLPAQLFSGDRATVNGGQLPLSIQNGLKPGKYEITLWQYTSGDPMPLIDSKPVTIKIAENPQKQPKLIVKSLSVNINGEDFDVHPGDILNINPEETVKFKFVSTWEDALVKPDIFNTSTWCILRTENLEEGNTEGRTLYFGEIDMHKDNVVIFSPPSDEDWLGYTSDVFVSYELITIQGMAYAKYEGTDLDAKYKINWTDEPTGIKSLNSTTTKVVERWNAQGMRLSRAEKGLNIVKYSDGSIRKEIVK